MRRFETNAGFKEALEELMGRKIPRNIWDIVLDFFKDAAIHAPYSEEDFGFAVKWVNRLSGLFKEKNGRRADK